MRVGYGPRGGREAPRIKLVECPPQPLAGSVIIYLHHIALCAVPLTFLLIAGCQTNK